MRFADKPTTSAQIDIAAPPQAVWQLVTDINLPANFSSEFNRAEWLDGAQAPALGARFRGHNAHAAIGEWTTDSEVSTLREGECFEWSVLGEDQPGAVWSFTLEPTENGTRLTQQMQIGPGRNGLSPAIDRWPDKEERIIAKRLAEHQENMTRTLAGIKYLAEQS